MVIKLPEKVKRLWIFGVLLLVLLLFAGGLYFRHQSLLTSQQLIDRSEEEGIVSGAYTNAPTDFPSDIPLFKPAEILSTLESQERIQLTLQTEAAAARVLQFYQKGMKETGWRLTKRGTGNDNGVLTFLKDGRHTQLVVTSEPGGGPTLVILSTTP